jgi:hypothetical protein
MSDNTAKRKKKHMKQPRQKQKTVEQTLEQKQEIKDFIAEALIQEVRQQKDLHDGNVKAIIVRRAKEYAKHCEKISDVSKELSERLANEKLCSKRHVRRILSGPEFQQFKDIHQSKRRSHPNKTKSGGHMSTQVSNYAPVVETEPETGPISNEAKTEQKQKPEPEPEQSLSQQTLDYQKAIDESDEIQKALGRLEKLLAGELTPEQTKASNEDVGKTAQRKILEESTDYIRMLAKRIPDGHFRSIKVSIGRVSVLIEQFEEAITNEAIIRKRTESMSGV